MHEARMHKESTFITLTYNNENIPTNGSLSKLTLQKFLRALRKRLKRGISYLACGEYGEKLSRPHYHAIIFGWNPKNQKIKRRDKELGDLYTSEELESTWTKGYSTCGAVTKESAGYVARYTCKKITGDGDGKKSVCPCGHKSAKEHYAGKQPEFQLQSTKPAIGLRWLNKYEHDVYDHDHVIVAGHETKPPRYYDKKHNERDPEHMRGIKIKREQKSEENNRDNSLRAKEAAEAIKISRLTYLKRRIENGTL
nr:MAG: replication initiator protein [Microviridae sp.]